MAWTSRERVIAALEHREPDRVPVDLNPLLDSYTKLKSFLGLEIKGEDLKPTSFGEVIPHPQVLDVLGVDLISVKLSSPKKSAQSPVRDGLIMDEWGVGYRRVYQSGGGSYLEAVFHPLAEASMEDLQEYPWPDPHAPGRGDGVEATAKRLYEDTDLALVGRFGGPIIEVALNMMGFENWLMAVVTQPDFAQALLDRIGDFQVALDRIGLEATAKYLQVLKLSGDDLGMQTGPLYSPRTFQEVLLPSTRRRWQAARAFLDQINPSVQLMFHCCGGIRPFIPALIEAGLQVLDPVQPRAVGMDSADLKRDFGDRLTFHGGVDEQQVLPFGSEADVEAEVRHRIQAFGAGGGYILAPSHFVQADTPPANIVAMCRAAHGYGLYDAKGSDRSNRSMRD